MLILLKAARRVFVVGDGSYIGRILLATICPVEEIDLLITGASAVPLVVERLRRRGVDVRIVR
jgi:DeoR/GlpR family transcriptional regulator of sugar metabolism